MLSGYSNWRTAVAGDTISSPHERTSAAFGLLCSIAKPGIPAACPIYLTLDWPECSEGVATDSMAGAWRFLLPQPAWMPHWHPSRLRPWGKPQRWLPRTRWQQQYPLERGGGRLRRKLCAGYIRLTSIRGDALLAPHQHRHRLPIHRHLDAPAHGNIAIRFHCRTVAS